MHPYLKLIRPLNGIMAAIAVWIGALLTGAAFMPDYVTLLGMAAAFLVCSGGMAINDFFDAKTDKLNKPDRPIAAEKITKRSALAVAGAFFIIGIAIAYYIGFEIFATAVVATGLLIAYAYLKKTILIGNLVISGLTALVFVFGSLLFNNYTAALPLALLIFLASMGKEIYKTIDDAMGDHKYRVNSLAIKVGVMRARIIGNIFLIVSVIFSFVPYFLGLLGVVYLFFVVIADIIFLLAAILPARFGSRLIKIGMVVAVIAFIAGVVKI